jgi:hypothetical protein
MTTDLTGIRRESIRLDGAGISRFLDVVRHW